MEHAYAQQDGSGRLASGPLASNPLAASVAVRSVCAWLAGRVAVRFWGEGDCLCEVGCDVVCVRFGRCARVGRGRVAAGAAYKDEAAPDPLQLG
eukprot:4954490-Prymnesium_polylepis.1